MLSTLAVISTGEHRPSRFVISEKGFLQDFKFDISFNLLGLDEFKIKTEIYLTFSSHFLKYVQFNPSNTGSDL